MPHFDEQKWKKNLISDVLQNGIHQWTKDERYKNKVVVSNKNTNIIFEKNFFGAIDDYWTVFASTIHIENNTTIGPNFIGDITKITKNTIEDLNNALRHAPMAEKVKIFLIQRGINNKTPENVWLHWCPKTGKIFLDDGTIKDVVEHSINIHLQKIIDAGILIDEQTNSIKPASAGICYRIPMSAHEKLRMLSKDIHNNHPSHHACNPKAKNQTQKQMHKIDQIFPALLSAHKRMITLLKRKNWLINPSNIQNPAPEALRHGQHKKTRIWQEH